MEAVSVDIVIVVMIPSGSTVVMTEADVVEEVVSVTGYNVSVVDEPSGLTLVIVMASSVLMGRLVVSDDSVEVGRTESLWDSVVVTVVVSDVTLVLIKVVVSSVVLITVVVVGLK